MVGILNIRPRSVGVSDIDLGATRLGQYWTRPWTSVVYLAYQPNSYAIYITYTKSLGELFINTSGSV